MDSNTPWKIIAGVVVVAWLSKGALSGVLGATIVPYILQFFGILYLLDLSTKGWKMPEVQLPMPSILWVTPTPTPQAPPAPPVINTLAPAVVPLPAAR